MHPRLTATRGHAALRVVVWALLALFLVAGAGILTATEPPAISEPSALAVSPNQSDTTVLAKGGALLYPGADQSESLPAWRWGSAVLDAYTGGNILQSALSQGPLLIANFFLAIANLTWDLLLATMRIGLNSGTLLALASGPINVAIAWLGTNLIALAGVFWAIALFRILKSLFSLHIVTALRSLLAFTAMFVLLLGTVQASTKATAIDDPQERLAVVGTLPWLANTASGLALDLISPVTGVVSGLASPEADTSSDTLGTDTFDRITTPDQPEDDVSQEVTPIGNEGPTPTCDQYIATIVDAYKRGRESNDALVITSALWQNTFYTSWTTAQYGLPRGNQNLPARTMCHYAEARSEVAPDTQWKIASSAYDASISKSSLVFGPFYNDDDRRRAMTAWAGCAWNGSSWETNEIFNGVWNRKAASGDDDDVFPGDFSCQNLFAGKTAAWYSGYTASIGLPILGEVTVADFSTDPYLIFGERLGKAFETAEGSDYTPEDLRPVADWALSATGTNGMERMLHSVIALITALVFAATFGAMAIGLLFAQLLLILCLMFVVPIAFVLVAIGNKKAGQLLRLTASSMFAQALFTLLITALLLISGVFQALFLSFDLPLLISSVAYGAAPLAAFYVLRKVLQKIGLGDIATGTGALSFATSATLRSTGDAQLGNLSRSAKGRKSAVEQAFSKAPVLGKALGTYDRNYSPGKWATFFSKSSRNERAEDRQARKSDRAARRRSRIDFLTNRMKNREDWRFSRLGRGLNAVDRLLMPGSLGWRSFREAMATASAKRGEGKGGLNVAGALAFRLIGGLEGGMSRVRHWARWHNRATSARALNATIPDEFEKFIEPVSYTPAQMLRGQDAREHARNAESLLRRRATHEKAKAGNEESGMAAMASILLTAVAAARLGSETELLDSERMGLLAKRFAESTGYSPDRILTTPGGVAIPEPMSREELRTQATEDQMRDFVHWLRDDEKGYLTMENGETETPAERAARLYAIGVARGLIESDGTPVDFLATRGIDLDDPNVRAQFENWQKGAAVALFDNLVSQASDSRFEASLVHGMYQVVRDQSARSVAMDMQGQQARAEELKVSVEALPGDTKALIDGLGAIASQLSSYQAAAERLANARDGGSEKAIAKAAAEFSQRTERLEEIFERSGEGIAEIMSRHADAMLAASSTMGASNEEMVELLSSVAGRLADVDDAYTKALDGFKQGRLSANAAEALLKDISEQISGTHAETGRLVSAAIDSLRDVTKAYKTSPRRGSTRTPRAEDWADQRAGVP